ncbi:DUF1439 domain-containing protein [Shewanella intestini]|uniref:DUF1439 domain-containing protein n=2 Tax=Shewanellaceae TaxID=267890 RepID=A0ABS5I5P4_9GAMM|nr:DUF1439 domain-containing protein [Shewanella intestini]
MLATVLAGCASQYSISEREIEQHLNKKMHFSVDQGNRLVGLAITLNDMNVSLGDKPDTISLSAVADIKVTNPLFPLKAGLIATFEAKPWYDKNTKAIYLKQLQLLNVKAEPEELQEHLAVVIPPLMTFIRGYLESKPVYILDESDSRQALMAKLATEIKVEKGKIVIKL